MTRPDNQQNYSLLDVYLSESFEIPVGIPLGTNSSVEKVQCM